MFSSSDWVAFYDQVTNPAQPLLTPLHAQEMQNNVYLLDFLTFILVRDPYLRPDISSILTRFRHLQALLIGNYQYIAPTKQHDYQTNFTRLVSLTQPPSSPPRALPSPKTLPTRLLPLSPELYIATTDTLPLLHPRLLRHKISHVVAIHCPSLLSSLCQKGYKYFLLTRPSSHEHWPSQALHLYPLLMDFLREALHFNAKTVFLVQQPLSPPCISPVDNLLLMLLSQALETSLLGCLTQVQHLSGWFSLPLSSLPPLHHLTSTLLHTRSYLSSKLTVHCKCRNNTLCLKTRREQLQRVSCGCVTPGVAVLCGWRSMRCSEELRGY